MRKQLFDMLAAAFLVASTEAQGASFQGLGDLDPNDDFVSSQAFAVSEDGSTVVGVSNFQDAFRWTESGGMQRLIAPGGKSAASGVSSDGSVIVGWITGLDNEQAFRWTEADGMELLGDLPGGRAISRATTVSSDGLVVAGQSEAFQVGGGGQAFRWTEQSGMVMIQRLSGGDGYGEPFGLSSDGSVLVGNGRSDNGNEAFRWTLGMGTTGLGDAIGGAFNSNARGGVSADGNRIAGQTTSANGDEAYLWTPDTGIVTLGDLEGGGVDSIAYDISADGKTIVGRGSVDGGQAAFIWEESYGMRNLPELLFSDKHIDMSCWALHDALGVSADGSVVVGVGINPDGQAEAWRADLSGLKVGTRIPGDTNGDDRVDLADLNNVRNNFDGRGIGDVDLNCGVGLSDLNLVRNNFGIVALNPVPEPVSFVLFSTALLGFLVVGKLASEWRLMSDRCSESN